MNTRKIIVLAVLLGLLGAALPIAGTIYLARMLALGAEQERLEQVGQVALQRAAATFDDASETLLSFGKNPPLQPCSQAHIEEMRRATLNRRAVEEMGYFADGFLKCTSWGPTALVIPRLPPDFTTRNGIGISLHVRPLVTGTNTMMALDFGAHHALVDPQRFVDLIVDQDVDLVVAHESGAILGEINEPEGDLVKQGLSSPEARRGTSASNVFAVTRVGEWIAVATSPKAALGSKLRRQMALLLPLGIIVATLIIAMVIWFSRRRLSPLAELEIAVRKREFLVHYQPLIELKTGACVGAEALVRWRRPDGTMVRPDLFLPLAEDSGMILPITDQVIETILRDLGPHLRADPSLHVAINVCADDMRTGRILAVLADQLRREGIGTHQIWLEATERGFVDVDRARATLTKARRQGYAVAIDDFGTGYSSLQYLQKLPLDALKIDKAFIDTIGTGSATSSVTGYIIEMAKALDLWIVAEGVETLAQASYLIEHGVHCGQGWLFSKPLPAREFIAYHAETRIRRGPPPVLDQPGSSPSQPARITPAV